MLVHGLQQTSVPRVTQTRDLTEAIGEQLLHTNVLRFPGGLVFKARRLCVSLNARFESKKEAEVLKLGPGGLSGG